MARLQGFGVHHAVSPTPIEESFGKQYAEHVADLISASTLGHMVLSFLRLRLFKRSYGTCTRIFPGCIQGD